MEKERQGERACSLGRRTSEINQSERKHDKIRMYGTEMKYGYQKYESIQQSSTSEKRVCGCFVVSDLHKVTEADIRFRSEGLLEEIEKHSDWMLESIIWDANHRIDMNREGLNIILDKAKIMSSISYCYIM